MKKQFKNLISCLLLICMVILVAPISANAIDESRLTVRYEVGQTEFKFYKIASFSETGVYDLEEPFNKYSDTISGLNHLENMDTEGWRKLASTLKNIVKTDIQPVKIMKTDNKGLLIWDGIPKGLYLILGEKTSDGTYEYTPSPVLVTVPNRDKEGNWTSDVVIHHNKVLKKEITKFMDLSVTKIWNDEGYEEKRPSSIEVTLYKGEEPYETITLNEENSWNYEWKDIPVEDWSVKEDNVPEGYQVAYPEEGEDVFIENTYVEKEKPKETPNKKLPQTGQLWWPVPILTTLGLMAFIIGWMKRRA